MKTLLVIYTNDRVLDSEKIAKTKKYSFNSESNLQVDDLIKSSKYDSLIQVTKVFDKSYKYYNVQTGEMSNEHTSTLQYEIKELIIREEEANVVYGTIVPQ